MNVPFRPSYVPLLALLLGAVPQPALAQMPVMPMPAMPTPSPRPSPSGAPADRGGMDMSSMRYNANGVMSMYGMTKSGMRMDMSALDPGTMPSTTDMGSPMTREGSGTSWMPDAGTVYGRMWGRGDDMEMTHGALFGEFVDTATPRGADALVAPGWFMYMRTHPTSPGAQLGFRAMLTPDPFSVGGQGYPELFQTGEQWHDQPLHDVQHPHDLLSELSLSYSGQLDARHSAFLYVGYPGEPALGPPAFMHRPLAYDFAPAPIGHHWEDATHITFGVVTMGFASTKLKLEASAFTGREPNQARYNFDPAHLDSHSARLSWNPNAYVAAQASYGFIRSPEDLSPDVDVRRTTASVMYTRPLGFESYWTNTLVWGQNHGTDGERANAYLYETVLRRNGNAVYARFEQVQKTGNDLVLPSPLTSRLFDVGAYTVGFDHDVPHRPGRTTQGVGVAFTLNPKPSSLDAVYGPGTPLSVQVYYRLRSGAMVGQSTTP